MSGKCGCSCGPIKPPAWHRAGASGALGVCPAGSLSQCGAIFTSNTASLTAAAPASTLTFTVDTSFFTVFRPAGLRFHVNQDDGLNNEEVDRTVAFTGINYQGINYKLDENNTPVSAFSLYGEHALSLIELGDLISGAQNVTIGIALLATALDAARTLSVSALMYGWSKRGAGGAAITGSAIVP